MIFWFFSPWNTQPLPNVQYVLKFSELLLHIHSHYQMCLLYSMGFSEFLFHIHSHYQMCLLYSMVFFFTYKAAIKCALHSWDFLGLSSVLARITTTKSVHYSREIFWGIFVCLFCKQCWSYFWSCRQCPTQKTTYIIAQDHPSDC